MFLKISRKLLTEFFSCVIFCSIEITLERTEEMAQSRFEMNTEEMEERIGRKIGTFEKIIHLRKASGKLTEWHLIGNVWINITP